MKKHLISLVFAAMALGVLATAVKAFPINGQEMGSGRSLKEAVCAYFNFDPGDCNNM